MAVVPFRHLRDILLIFSVQTDVNVLGCIMCDHYGGKIMYQYNTSIPSWQANKRWDEACIASRNVYVK
jgi:hypothetical protein